MTDHELYEHRLALAHKRGDRLALAVLEGGRIWSPEPADRIVPKALRPLPTATGLVSVESLLGKAA